MYTVIVKECFEFQYQTFETLEKARKYAQDCEESNFQTLILRGEPSDWLVPNEILKKIS